MPIEERERIRLCERMKRELDSITSEIGKLPPGWVREEHLSYVYYLRKLIKDYGC